MKGVGQAGFYLDGVDGLMAKLESLASGIDGAMEDAVQAGGEVLTEELVKAVHEAADRGYSQGTLETSIESDGIKNVNGGKMTTIYPHGTDTHSKGMYTKVIGTSKRGHPITRVANAGGSVRNYDKLWYLEYGTARQAAHPFMRKALNDARPKVMEAMKREIDAAIESASRS
jgi:HK97 gp10 family phage protein